MADKIPESPRTLGCDAYFERIQSRKRLPFTLQEALTDAFANIPVSSFPQVPGGKLKLHGSRPFFGNRTHMLSHGTVIEIPADIPIVEAVKILSEQNIMSAPVRNPDAGTSLDWRDRYLGIIDYSAIILWVLENAEIAAVALSAGSATAAGVGVGALGTIGAVALGATGPMAVAGLTVAAVGAAVAGGMVAERVAGKDAPTAAGQLGEDFYNVIVHEEPFKSATVQSIIKSFRWTPFLPVALDSSMLTVLLLLSKYRLRSVPVIETGKPFIRNFITQSAVVQGLRGCRGRDWFDSMSGQPLSDFGLPFMSSDEVISVKGDELILEAFKLMKDNQIGGVPVLDGSSGKIIGNISIRDIRFLLLRSGVFSNFRQLTAADFMDTIVSITETEGTDAAMKPAVTCKVNTTIGSVIETLATRHIHRVYVVDDKDEVIGVVTLRDVISCFIYEPPNHFDNYLGFAVMEMLNK